MTMYVQYTWYIFFSDLWRVQPFPIVRDILAVSILQYRYHAFENIRWTTQVKLRWILINTPWKIDSGDWFGYVFTLDCLSLKFTIWKRKNISGSLAIFLWNHILETGPLETGPLETGPLETGPCKLGHYRAMQRITDLETSETLIDQPWYRLW